MVIPLKPAGPTYAIAEPQYYLAPAALGIGIVFRKYNLSARSPSSALTRPYVSASSSDWAIALAYFVLPLR